MHEVRVCQNPHEGALWWAEDDRGYTGGADTLAELLTSVREWAASEGTLDGLAVRHVGSPGPLADPAALSHQEAERIGRGSPKNQRDVERGRGPSGP